MRGEWEEKNAWSLRGRDHNKDGDNFPGPDLFGRPPRQDVAHPALVSPRGYNSFCCYHNRGFDTDGKGQEKEVIKI